MDGSSPLNMWIYKSVWPVCVFTVLSNCVSVRVYHGCRDVAALSAMSWTASSRVAAGENDDDEIKILRLAEGAAAISLAAVRIDLFQHLTFNHDKTVGKLIVLQDIRHQSPLILSGAPRRMNTNRLSRQPSHPSLPSLFFLSFSSLSLFFFFRLPFCFIQLFFSLLCLVLKLSMLDSFTKSFKVLSSIIFFLLTPKLELEHFKSFKINHFKTHCIWVFLFNKLKQKKKKLFWKKPIWEFKLHTVVMCVSSKLLYPDKIALMV